MPLNKKGKKIKSSMTKRYGKKKGESIFYAMENSGKLKAVCCSFGWLVEQNSKTTVIMADFIFEDNGVIKQGGGHTVIPTKNILKIKKVKI